MKRWVPAVVAKGTAASESDCPGDCSAKIAVPLTAPVRPVNCAHPVTREPVSVVWMMRTSPGSIRSVMLETVPSAPSGRVSAAPPSFQNDNVKLDACEPAQTIRNVVFQPPPLAIWGMILLALVTPVSASIEVNALPLARMPRPEMLAVDEKCATPRFPTTPGYFDATTSE